MKKKSPSTSEKITHFLKNEIFNNQEFSNILKISFGRYAKHIIQNRALPDFKDGLKPVHRRIIYAMAEGLKLTHKSNYKKSARVVGEVIGKYHPHGDTSVYAALVRMSQPWKMRYPLIDFHGNNGSIDGDPPAAMRYTEVRLSRYAEALFKDTKKELVQFINNFDDTEVEPLYFPGLLPNLFLNGNSGIAAGYSTNIPPHNLFEFISGLIAYIKNPNISLKEVVNIIKGPDFPTAGIILNKQDLEKIYQTGKGKIIISGKIFIKSDNNSQHYLEITEIPYDVPKSIIVKQIEAFRANQAYDLITKIIDLSDKNGIRIIIGIKDLEHAESLKNLLLKKTFLRIQYSCNFVVIINSKPREIGILDYFVTFFKFLFEFHTVKYNHYLKLLNQKQIILSGFMRMVSILDEVIKVIRNSKTRQDAIKNLISNFKFLEVQATAIVELKLYRLTSTDILSLQEEYENNKQKIKELKQLLNHKDLLTAKIVEKLENLKLNFQDNRLTEITNNHLSTKLDVEEQIFINKNDYLLTISSSSYVWTDEITANNEDKVINKLPRIKTSDYVAFKEIVKYNQEVVILTKSGYIVSLPITKLNKAQESENGIYLPGFTKSLPSNSPTLAVFSYKHSAPIIKNNQFLFFVTKNGKVKLIEIDKIFGFKQMFAKKVINLETNHKWINGEEIEDEDKIIYCQVVDYLTDNILLITNNSKYLLFPVHNLKPQGFGSKGQIGIKLKPSEEVAFAVCISDLKNLILFLSTKFKTKDINPMLDFTISERTKKGKSLSSLLSKNFKIKTIFSFEDQNIIGININNDHGFVGYFPVKKLKLKWVKNQILSFKKQPFTNINFSYYFLF